MKARIENHGNTQFVFVPKQENAQSQWSQLYKFIDTNSVWSRQLPYVSEALATNQALNKILEKINLKMAKGERLKRFDEYLEEEIGRRDLELRKSNVIIFRFLQCTKKLRKETRGIQ